MRKEEFERTNRRDKEGSLLVREEDVFSDGVQSESRVAHPFC